MKRTPYLFAAVPLLLALTACPDNGGGGGEAAPKKGPAKAGGAMVDDVPEVAPEAEVARYTYQPIGKRDPFRSFLERGGPRVDAEGPVGPLQKHEIDNYHLRGVVWNTDTPKGLVEDPEGIGHVVELGTLIGKNWGKVTQIKPDELIITEEYRDPIENELIVHEVSMRLPTPDADGDGREKKKL